MPPPRYIAESELLARCRWFLHLRWAFAAALVVLLLLNAWLRFQRYTAPIWVLTGLIAAYNVALTAYARRRLNFCLIAEAPSLRRRISGFASVQMVLDLAALTALLRYSGGVENPLVLFYIFHMILASILLSKRASYLVATLAVVMLASLAVCEMQGVLKHYGFLSGVIEPVGLYRSRLFVAAQLAIFGCAMVVSVHMTTSIAENLRRRETQLLDATAHLREANARLQDLESRKSQFMLVAAHQLKSPLSAIVSLLRVAESGPVGPEKEKELRWRAIMRAKGAVHQVEELLHLARLREVTPEGQQWQVLDFREVVDSVRSAVAAQVEARQQALVAAMPDRPARVEGSAKELFDAVLNLVENATKYTSDKGEIEVRLEADDDDWALSVKDTGCGIPETQLPNVFQEFFRGSNAMRQKIEGTGLGLSIVRQIVELHHGRISVQSEQGRGTTFTVWLPRAP